MQHELPQKNKPGQTLTRLAWFVGLYLVSLLVLGTYSILSHSLVTWLQHLGQ